MAFGLAGGQGAADTGQSGGCGADGFDQVTFTEADSGVEQLNRAHGQPKPDGHLPGTPRWPRDDRVDGKAESSATSRGVLSGDLFTVRTAYTE